MKILPPKEQTRVVTTTRSFVRNNRLKTVEIQKTYKLVSFGFKIQNGKFHSPERSWKLVKDLTKVKFIDSAKFKEIVFP